MELTKTQQKYVDSIIEHSDALGIDINKVNFSRAELRLVSMMIKGKKWIPNWITHDQSRRVDRGLFSIPEIMETANPQSVSPGQETDGDGLADVSPQEATVGYTDVLTEDAKVYIEDDPQSDVNQQAMEEITL